jgi:hypothetical protein
MQRFWSMRKLTLRRRLVGIAEGEEKDGVYLLMERKD